MIDEVSSIGVTAANIYIIWAILKQTMAVKTPGGLEIANR